MKSIQLLSDDVRSKIAAGEVIDRPASVVKELVENSLDAGSTEIRIELRVGGREMIRVLDNGAGVPAEELLLAISPHATSKLRGEEDLLKVQTLGFRGEALSSIAAVARLSIASSTSAGHNGRMLVSQSGRVHEDEVYAGARGTDVTVSSLFANYPVRLEFLKSDRTELFHVINVTQKLALGHPHVRFIVSSDDRVSFQTPGTGRLIDAVAGIYGAKLLRDVIELSPGAFQGLEGFVGQPGRDRPNRRYISFFVNGRWVTSRTLLGALTEAYRSMMPAGRHPVAIMHLTVSPEGLDVNIHPTKTEVRFREEGMIFTRVSKAIRRTLIEKGDFVPISVEQTAIVDSFFVPSRQPQPSFDHSLPRSPSSDVPSKLPRSTADADTISSEFQNMAQVRTLGQIAGTYIVASAPNGLFLIDQHAAHERVNYERLLAEKISVITQHLLSPAAVEMRPDAAAWISENVKALQELGFILDHFGDTTWLIRAVPAISSDRDPQALFTDIVSEMLDIPTSRGDFTERARWSVACHSSIRAGDSLAEAEMQALLEALAQCDLGRTCPHGRPTVLQFTKSMLDQQFGRS